MSYGAARRGVNPKEPQMNRDNMNNIVAKEFSDALARCNEQGIDAGTVRTGLLTIAIANFVNGIGLQNTVSLFEVLPDQIRSGMFDRFVDPSHPAVVNPAPPYREPVSVTQQQPIDVNRHGKPSQSQPEPAASAIKRRRL
tara:strand:- start:1407 stop:1826 length:420 start_codon:yes stop_codon:yes gene_type:complete